MSIVEIIDRPRIADDAREIGVLFRKARASAVESVRYLIEAGHKLAKQKELSRGQWILWLQANERTLGFGPRTAQRLLKLSKYDVNVALGSPEQALLISREIWGNQAKALASTSTEEQPDDHGEEGEETTGAENEQPDEDREEHEQPDEEVGEADDNEQTGEDEAGDEGEDELGPRAPRLSRPKQWQKAVAEAAAAIEHLIELQSEYQDWRDKVPDNLADSALAQKLDEVCGLSFESAQEEIRAAEDVELPLGFGRD